MNDEPVCEIMPLLQYTKDKTASLDKSARSGAMREQEEEERSGSSSSSSREENAPSSHTSTKHTEFQIRKNASVVGGGDLLRSGGSVFVNSSYFDQKPVMSKAKSRPDKPQGTSNSTVAEKAV